ncbi:conserved Plasmodium protein, unknown function [Plasmodium knowlesi strain H]|uniref:Uncharacterized protein n=3 Tax=Plasmodium knowlesi TaxID=5850 RepID=A0A5K1UP95_PLAKH|nr:uncharacterized protein PKNH_0804700 [Plasmodium knowlesi strain H]OTN66102.1 Uncharacterized protein PKNOH_S100032500 [Plasmodium knowlesi]CAA9987690.1 conserved protein, unknown function [Plasmodium knowlesi strain H]SBO26909.1 conserved Plasmodium protein, unknown function [Plasmodium knowlesi strain H]SBO29632.1 conserved Plasmodium protein, unknown function [Plasmodium knowlesi strain H]VVS77164.1 conserved protein, unknown function [Plasmodium knowlesi strain H]|eukprot:XP_002258688.1 [Plasmodium knowlesi strain H]
MSIYALVGLLLLVIHGHLGGYFSIRVTSHGGTKIRRPIRWKPSCRMHTQQYITNHMKKAQIRNKSGKSVGYPLRRTKVQMILAPKGSMHEKKTKEILEDPVKNYPWEISIPFHETITKELSPYYNFLKSEWAYIDHKKDVRRPCGKIEGGIENYDGKGLKLEKGVDRPRYNKMAYYDDHGVEWRNINQDELIRFDFLPDGNQDQTFLETEEDLEHRQWGNWNYNASKETTQLNSAWRDPVLSKSLTNLIYPWNHKAHENHAIPYGYTSPALFIPEPKIEWELAARGFFAGYYEDTNWSRIKYYKQTKKLILQWHDESKKEDGESDSRIVDRIKMELFGLSAKRRYPSKQIKLINDHALLRAKEIVLDHLLNPSGDPDYITYFLDRHEPLDYIGGGNHNCSDEEIKNKTVVLNMCVYPVKQRHETYSKNMSISEMAEMYHYYMTEIRGEGRSHQSSEDPVEDRYQCYELQKQRKQFPALVSLYKPLWTNKKFGEEFGDALQQGQKIRIDQLHTFNRKLKLKRKNKLTPEQMDSYNYVDDYSHVDDEYEF